MSDQMPLFDLPSSQAAPEAAQSVETTLRPRSDGWVLLAPPGGVWHLIARRRYDGLLTAMCGAEGRFVPEAEHEIMACSACEAADPTT